MTTMKTSMLAAFLVLTSACSGGDTRPDKVAPPPPPLEPGIYRVADGQRVDFEAFVDKAATYAVVVVGEQHDQVSHHAFQARVYGALLRRSPDRPVALGMEMFQRPFQGVLDAYVSGEIEQDEMLQRSEYAQRWGFEASMYAPLWSQARTRGAPVIALNVRRELTRRVATVGVKGLTEAERADLPEMDLDDPTYLAWMNEIFAQHGAGGHGNAAMVERFFQAQVLWDETMAESAARCLREREDVGQILIAVGAGHVRRGIGLPKRLKRRLGADKVLTVVPEDAKAGAGALATWRKMNLADYVWVP